MKIYNWRHNFTTILTENNQSIKGKVAFKTKETHWLNTTMPGIITLSIHSKFHQDLSGALKMHALISTIKKHVEGRITILFTEMAHLHVQSLQMGNDYLEAFDQSLLDAQNLHDRFQNCFESCDIAYWHELILDDPYYPHCVEQINQLHHADTVFYNYLMEDLELLYRVDGERGVSSQEIYTQHAIKDLLEQCAAHLVLAHLGYRFNFYPGSPYKAIQYVNQHLLKAGSQIDHIHVFLAIEKKVYLDRSEQASLVT